MIYMINVGTLKNFRPTPKFYQKEDFLHSGDIDYTMVSQFLELGIIDVGTYCKMVGGAWEDWGRVGWNGKYDLTLQAGG